MIELGLILVIDYTSGGNAAFGTASIPFSVWALVVPFTVAMLGLEELRKSVLRRRGTEKVTVRRKFTRPVNHVSGH